MAADIRREVGDQVAELQRDRGLTPGLATVLVGDDPPSRTYVGMKGRAANEAGIHSRQIDLPLETTEEELLGTVEGLNADPEVHGILVQLPLPPQIREERVLEAVDPRKDVDGFHPVNAGRLTAGSPKGLAPCTPLGIVELLLRHGYDPHGWHAVVVGRSNIVGRPLASLLLRDGRGGNATVTVAHHHTTDLAAHTRMADLLVVAAGHPELVTADMVKEGAVVMDVGVTRVEDPAAERGYRLVGDVAFDEVREVAEAVTPVPGGVGPMTIAMLLSNTVKAALELEGAEAGESVA